MVQRDKTGQAVHKRPQKETWPAYRMMMEVAVASKVPRVDRKKETRMHSSKLERLRMAKLPMAR